LEIGKIQFTGVFPLSDATDVTLDCKNDMVLSQNAFSTKGSIIIRFFKFKFGDKISSFADLGKYFNQNKWFLSSQKYDPGFPSRIRIPDLHPDFLHIPDPDPGSQIPNPGIKKATDP
jgi:hypothetical protein